MCKESPLACWDVEPEDPSQIDEDEIAAKPNVGLVVFPLAKLNYDESSSSSDFVLILISIMIHIMTRVIHCNHLHDI